MYIFISSMIQQFLKVTPRDFFIVCPGFPLFSNVAPPQRCGSPSALWLPLSVVAPPSSAMGLSPRR